jgi:hypothetical protein
MTHINFICELYKIPCNLICKKFLFNGYVFHIVDQEIQLIQLS